MAFQASVIALIVCEILALIILLILWFTYCHLKTKTIWAIIYICLIALLVFTAYWFQEGMLSGFIITMGLILGGLMLYSVATPHGFGYKYYSSNLRLITYTIGLYLVSGFHLFTLGSREYSSPFKKVKKDQDSASSIQPSNVAVQEPRQTTTLHKAIEFASGNPIRHMKDRKEDNQITIRVLWIRPIGHFYKQKYLKYDPDDNFSKLLTELGKLTGEDEVWETLHVEASSKYRDMFTDTPLSGRAVWKKDDIDEENDKITKFFSDQAKWDKRLIDATEQATWLNSRYTFTFYPANYRIKN